MLRRLTQHPAIQPMLSRLGGRYLALVYATTRWTLVGEENLRLAFGEGSGGFRPVICCFWHERLPLMSRLWVEARARIPGLEDKWAHVLVSRHRDGYFIGGVINHFRLTTIHGSSSQGGASGLRGLVRLLKDGETVAITPDGPRGPRRTAAPGVAQLAALANLPVTPCAARTTNCKVLRSWDRMVVPLPFARGVLVVGPPIMPDRRDPEAAIPAIEAALNAVSDEADRACGAIP